VLTGGIVSPAPSAGPAVVVLPLHQGPKAIPQPQLAEVDIHDELITPATAVAGATRVRCRDRLGCCATITAQREHTMSFGQYGGEAVGRGPLSSRYAVGPAISRPAARASLAHHAQSSCVLRAAT
jgi:hypothetical protein